jgi:hypothetical protein
VAADGFKRQWLMVGHYSTIKRRRAANPTKKRRKKHGGFQDGGALKIFHAPGGLALSKGMGNGDGAIGFEAGRPKSVVEMDGGERRGPDGVIVRRRAGRRQVEAKNDSERSGKKTTTGECGFLGDTLI